MLFSLTLLVVVGAPAELPTEFRQVAPERKATDTANPPRSKDRCVLLIPGLKIHLFKPSNAMRPEIRDYQLPGSELVRTLAKDSDVFAFGYAQTVTLDDVARSPGLLAAVTEMKNAGYTEIVLVGHSAGGVIARVFAETHPDSGVTKVITVAAPHCGSEIANLRVGYPKVQAAFVESLSPEARTRAGFGKIHDKLQMACIVCKLKPIDADGLVGIRSQWPEECRKVGVPAAVVQIDHWHAMLNTTSIAVIADLTKQRLVRWSADEAEKAQKMLLRVKDEK